MEITYMFHLQFVLSWRWTDLGRTTYDINAQISIFASSNYIHHHTYFKNPYVHIQVFHILHYHTMKLLQAFKSFLT